MKNKMTDLNNHLFAQLERLGDEELTSDELEKEIERSKAIANIASNIVEGARVSVEALKVMEKAGMDISKTDNGVIQLLPKNTEL